MLSVVFCAWLNCGAPPALASQTSWCCAAPASLGRLSLPLFAECNALFLSPPLVFPISFNFFFSNVGARLFESAQNIYAEGQISLRRIWRGKLRRPAKGRGRRGVAGGGSAVPKGTAKASHGQLFWASVYYSSTKHSAGGADLGPWG